jgi:hypothetical protein
MAEIPPREPTYPVSLRFYEGEYVALRAYAKSVDRPVASVVRLWIRKRLEKIQKAREPQSVAS